MRRKTWVAMAACALVQPDGLVQHHRRHALCLADHLLPAALCIVVAMSFATRTPTAPPFSFGGEHPLINLDGYAPPVPRQPLYPRLSHIVMNAVFATVLCLLIGYPMALG